MRLMRFLLLLLTFSCSVKNSTVFDQSFNRDTVSLCFRQKFSIVLPSNPTTGYKWGIDSSKSGFFSLESALFVQNNSGVLGSGGREIFFFQAPEENLSRLSMVYKRDWEEKPGIDSFVLFFKLQTVF
ncbi:protease inhibitor I42 family protein [candidate division WOR-3 bacterium]|nr:protease inhibitor I42 family protein [candidate division WOR-3 bacterium]